MIIGRAPVRVSFGGGGTDLAAYYDHYGGAVLSTTIDKYFYTVLHARHDDNVHFSSYDYNLQQLYKNADEMSDSEALRIPNAVLSHFEVKNGLNIHLESDVPHGSGLGLSGAVTVNLLNTVALYCGKKVDKKTIAELASEIEIHRLSRSIGLQDQYASAYGGLNFFTFSSSGVVAEPVVLSPDILEELDNNLLLFFTGISRNSATILKEQTKASKEQRPVTIESLHEIKALAYKMRETLESGNLPLFGELLHQSWLHKKKVTEKISSNFIDSCYEAALKQGATGGKIAGAGGGGFLILYCKPEYHANVRDRLQEMGLFEVPFTFEKDGVTIIWNELDGAKKMITPEGYLAGINSIVKRLPIDQIKEIVELLYTAYKQNKQVFVMGNGGAAATASHMSCDLAKTVSSGENLGFRVIPLTDNVALMTALGNDDGYENIFFGQLRNLVQPGDIVIGFSCAGKSKSVIKAIKHANAKGAYTIGISGMTGAELKEEAKLTMVVPSDNYQFIEDTHLLLAHMITSILRERINEDDGISG